MQSKKGSFAEACTNTLIGFTTTLIFTPIIYWICGIETSSFKMGLSTALFTIISVIRSYIVRRFFNSKIK